MVAAPQAYQPLRAFFFLLLSLQGALSTILLERLTLTQISQSFSVVYSSPFAAIPQLALSLESLLIQTNEFSVSHNIGNITETTSTLSLAILTTTGMLSGNTQIKICLILTDQEWIKVSVQQIAFAQTTHLITYGQEFGQDYFISLLPMLVPSDISVSSSNSTGLYVQIMALPVLLPLVSYQVSYLLVSREFLIDHVAVMFLGVNHVNPNYIIALNRNGFVVPSEQSVFFGLTSYSTSSSTINITKSADYNLYESSTHSSALAIGYVGAIDQSNWLYTLFFAFNNDLVCAEGNYFSYPMLYYRMPTTCAACHWTCKTCSTATEDPTFTSQSYCKSCNSGRFYNQLPAQSSGSCNCLPGLKTDALGNCIECSFNCLSFNVQFMRSQVLPKFILIFTKTNVISNISWRKNLQLSIDGQIIAYSIIESKAASHILTVDSNLLAQCEDQCIVNFYFLYPQEVYTQDTLVYLSTQQQDVSIRNYFIVEDRLPKELNQAFLVTGILIGAASATGQTSLIKMLFQLEQIIQYHKYLNLQIPVVFKQFIEALSTFQFLDLTFFIPSSAMDWLSDRSSDELDGRGPVKAVYYDNGANYYKNIVGVLISLVVVIALNIFLCFLMLISPCNFLNKLGKKIKIRFSLTLSDVIESIVLPGVLYYTFQSSYTIMRPIFTWAYLFQFVVLVSVMLCPFLLLSTQINKLKKAHGVDRQILKEVLEDLFQDCRLGNNLAMILYIASYLRKLSFGLILNQEIPGLVQIFLMILVNFVQVSLIVYMVANRLYTSRLKVITRSINAICIIGIEFLILAYNVSGPSTDRLILIGVTCTYLTIIATITGFIEIFAKLVDTLFQRIKGSNKVESEQSSTQEVSINNTTMSRLMCRVGKEPLKIGHTQDSGSSEDTGSQSPSRQDVKIINEHHIKKKRQFDNPDETRSDNSQIVPMGSNQKLIEDVQDIWNNKQVNPPSSAGETAFFESGHKKKRNRYDPDSPEQNDKSQPVEYHRRPRNRNARKDRESMKMAAKSLQIKKIETQKQSKKKQVEQMSEILDIADDFE